MFGWVVLKPRIVKAGSREDVLTAERCLVSEIWGSADDERVSIAHAVVKPGVATVAHHLEGVTEIYLMLRGKGKVEVEGLKTTEVGKGDLVFIPAGASQKITNIGKTDLVFYCICAPKFNQNCYRSEETHGP